MPKNREKMAELMQRLQNLYQQVENVHPDESKLIVEEHINKLEYELFEYLYYSLKASQDERILNQIINGVR